MQTSFRKPRRRNSWCIAAFLGIGLFFLALSPHKFYVSLFEINQGEESLEITLKTFVDDLEMALGEKLEASSFDSLHEKYLLNHFSLRVNGQPLQVSFLGSEMDENDLMVRWTYIEVPFRGRVNSLEVETNYLTDVLPDQVNIIQFKADSECAFSDMLTKDKILKKFNCP